TTRRSMASTRRNSRRRRYDARWFYFTSGAHGCDPSVSGNLVATKKHKIHKELPFCEFCASLSLFFFKQAWCKKRGQGWHTPQSGVLLPSNSTLHLLR